jgi:hypothetical protein
MSGSGRKPFSTADTSVAGYKTGYKIASYLIDQILNYKPKCDGPFG